MDPSDFKIRYDKTSDVLYVVMANVPATSDEGSPGVLWRHALNDGTLVGVTILDFDHYWRKRLDLLAKDLSRGLHVPPSVARKLLQSATQ